MSTEYAQAQGFVSRAIFITPLDNCAYFVLLACILSSMFTNLSNVSLLLAVRLAAVVGAVVVVVVVVVTNLPQAS